MEAAQAGQVEVVRFLLTRSELELTCRDWLGRTTLHRAIVAGQVEVVRALLAACNEVAQVATRDWKNNHILDDVKEGEIKKMVLLRIAGLEDEQELNEQGPELSREEFNVEHSAKEVREGHKYNMLEIMIKAQMLKII